jgi:amino acid permease
MYKLGNLQTLLKPHNKNWALIIPLGAVLGPLLAVGRGQEYALPTLLAVPSLLYIGLFAYSMFVELKAEHNQDADKLQPGNTS